MAWTKTEYTYTLAPAHNLNWVTALNSTDYNENSFRYSFDIRMTDIGGTFTPGLTGTSLGTFYVPPRPVTGEGKFNPSGIWKDNMYTILDPAGASGAGATGTGYQSTQVTYGYNYINTSGIGVTGSPLTGATKRTWSAIFDYEEWVNYDDTEWEVRTTPGGSVNFLTDGPTSRCSLNNDLLYVLIGPYTPSNFTWNRPATIANKYNFQSQCFYSGVWQEATNPDSTGGTDLTWSCQSGTGVYAGSYPYVNSYSNILFTDPSNEYATAKPAAVVTIRFSTSTLYSAQTSGYHLYGRRTDNGVWEYIDVFVEYNLAGQQAWELVNVPVPSGYGYDRLGLAVDAGYSFTARITEITEWKIVNPGGYAWEIDYGTSITNIDAESSKMNYLNTGSLALGATGDYSVSLVHSGSGVAFTKTINYDYDCKLCGNCEDITLTWLNSKGGFDSFKFICTNTKEYSVNRQQANRFLGEGYSLGQRGFMNPKNVMQLTKTVNTNYTTEADITWLESLLLSPEVYELRDNNTVIPVIVDSNSYQTWVTPDKLKIAEFNYRLGYNINSQNV